MLDQSQITAVMNSNGNVQQIYKDFELECFMGNCEIIDDDGDPPEYLTIILSIAAGLIAIIIALSIAVYCLRKKYKVSLNNQNGILFMKILFQLNSFYYFQFI